MFKPKQYLIFILILTLFGNAIPQASNTNMPTKKRIRSNFNKTTLGLQKFLSCYPVSGFAFLAAIAGYSYRDILFDSPGEELTDEQKAIVMPAIEAVLGKKKTEMLSVKNKKTFHVAYARNGIIKDGIVIDFDHAELCEELDRTKRAIFQMKATNLQVKLEDLDQDWNNLRFIAGHEAGHIKHNDGWRTPLAIFCIPMLVHFGFKGVGYAWKKISQKLRPQKTQTKDEKQESQVKKVSLKSLGKEAALFTAKSVVSLALLSMWFKRIERQADLESIGALGADVAQAAVRNFFNAAVDEKDEQLQGGQQRIGNIFSFLFKTHPSSCERWHYIREECKKRGWKVE
ncbi:M48 family metalloprotease [Candidatus Babeliales bacterium]|nr:M48 family metalloprotease [Candidatus Babeliales bacterium]